jgi:hypothetical protein
MDPYQQLLDYADQIQALLLATPNPPGWSLVTCEGWEVDTDESGSIGLLAVELKMIL